MHVTTSVAQNTSNKGKDFWLGYGNHQRGYNLKNQRMVLYITSDVNTDGRIEIPGIGYSAQFHVTANSIEEVSVPQEAYLEDEGIYDRGIHVTAEKPIVIYSHIYDLNVSGATLVLPTNVLGKEYYSINYKQVSNQDTSFSYFFVVGIEDGTEVEITPSVNTVGGKKAGESYVVTLNRGQVYQVLGEKSGQEIIQGQGGRPIVNYKGADLTGSVIRSVSNGINDCKRIAVFSGSGKMSIGCEQQGAGSADNLYQQVYPTTGWGRKTITVPLASRNYDVIRIVKSNPSAVVKLNGSVLAPGLFVNNFYYEFDSQSVNVIESDLPVQVVQYAVSQGKGINCTGSSERTGDPEMIYLNSVEQNIDRITVYSPAAYRIAVQFINVVIETPAVADFKLDGVSQTSLFRIVADDPAYSYAQLPVSAGVHTLSASKGFNAVAYGFGNAESYGYSAGTNVKGQTLNVVNKTTGNVVTSGCTSQPLLFSVDLLYEVNKLTWNLDNGEPPVEEAYSSPASVYTRNGKTYYRYELHHDALYSKPGDYNLEITADKTTSDGCGSSEIFQLDFSVYDPAGAEFSNSPACENTEIQFTDLTEGKGAPVNSWLWDFGDNATSSEQHPRHTYLQPGIYPVRLTVTTESGCGPVSVSKQVTVFKNPKADFTISGNCEGKGVFFTDASVAEEGTIVQWIWDFGDGQTETMTSDLQRRHVYAATGTYHARLTVITDKGCSNTKQSDLIIHPVPQPDFLLPEVCLKDSQAKFADLSTIADHSEADFIYDWDFGDGSPHSAEKNPVHPYHNSGYYDVVLKVTSGKGCDSTITKRLTVNGDDPVARFKVLNENDLCSKNEVVFVNESQVGFGNITRLEWYFDNEGDPANMLVDDDPGQGKEQRHLYPQFSSPATKEYKVRLKAFSGGVCTNETIVPVTLKAVPEIQFDVTVQTICEEAAPVYLKASETTGNFNKQDETYTGDGVTPNGLFDPEKAGPGSHEISYVYTAQNECPDTISQTITVNPTPSVDAGEDVKIREGFSVKLIAKTDPDVVKYQWSPAAGLNRTDIPNPVASPFDNTTYTLTVTNANGCRNSSRVRVTVDKYPVIHNTFTPNGDGTNDTWVVDYLDRYPEATVEIFNRYGARVYKSQGYSQPWDGTFNGGPLPEGVYYYIIDPKNGMGPYKGYVTIIR